MAQAKKRMGQIGKRIEKDIREYGMFGVALAGYYLVSKWLFHAFCPLVIISGIPCPGCGMTRAFLFFLTGQWTRGWNMNPLALAWLALAAYIAVMRYGFGKKAKGALPFAYGIIGLMVLFYGYRMLRYFPGWPPVSYTGGNLLEQFLPGYRSFILHIRDWI